MTIVSIAYFDGTKTIQTCTDVRDLRVAQFRKTWKCQDLRGQLFGDWQQKMRGEQVSKRRLQMVWHRIMNVRDDVLSSKILPELLAMGGAHHAEMGNMIAA
jgi:hypothetical protein